MDRGQMLVNGDGTMIAQVTVAQQVAAKLRKQAKELLLQADALDATVPLPTKVKREKGSMSDLIKSMRETKAK